MEAISEPLRRTIRASKMPLLTLQKATGVNRTSIRLFLIGQQHLRLDMADRLAAYFALRLTKGKGKR